MNLLKTKHVDGSSGFTPAVMLVAALLVCFGFPVWGQSRIPVSGTVFSRGEPVIGAAVVVKGTNIGTTTDIGGKYSIEAATDAVLIVSAIGYETVEESVAGRSKIDFDMAEITLNLEDAVVVGYGVQKKVNLTGSVASVNLSDIEGKPVANVVEGLQGTVPGLVIQQGSSTPGDSPTINIRGYNTMNDNNPLIIIDGIEGSLANLNPKDIDQISILKDASSTAIYGSRASNGVILVTTKRGSEDHTEVSYSMNYGIQQATALPTVVDSWIYAELYNEAAVNSGRSIKFTAEDIAAYRNGGTNVKWIEEIYKDYAPEQSHSLSFTGGSKNISYMASFGYLEQNSLFKGPDYGYERYNGRLNLLHRFNEKFKVGFVAQFTRNNTKDHAYWTEWLIEQANRMPPIYEIKNSDGTYTYPSGSNSNCLERLEKGGYRRSVNDDISGVATMDWAVFNDFTLSTSLGGRVLENQTHENRWASDAAASGDTENHIAESFYRSLKLTATVTANYSRTFAGKHNLGALAGYSYEGESTNNFGTTRTTEDHKYDVMVGTVNGTEQLPVSNYSGASDWALYSVFGRVTYNYDEKYLFEANIRNDHSSYFAKGHRSGVFPSFSAGWRISQEEWYAGMIKDFIPSVKLRGSWGLVGNNRIGAYNYLQTISVSQGANFGGVAAPAASYSSANSDIKWETTRMADIGVDASFLPKGNLTASFDYFNNLTKDILVSLSVPGIFGNGSPISNAAKVKTVGWEFSAAYDFVTGKVRHHVAGNIADSYNEVVDTRGIELFSGSDVQKIIKEGYPLYSYYALRSDGLFQSDEEAASSPHLEGIIPKAGDIKYIDKDNNGVIDDNDRFVVGNDFPRYTFGFTYGLEFKGFTFSVFLQGVGKRSCWMRGEAVEAFHNNNEGPVLDFHIDRWTPDNTDASYPRLTMGSESTNNAYKSDFWIQDASYLRVKNIQIGYKIPKSVIQKIGIKELQVLMSCENALTFSNMKGGWDPEYNADGSGRAYPVARVLSGGLNVKFQQ